MDQYSFSLVVPEDCFGRIEQLLSQLYSNEQLAQAATCCEFEFEDLGLAYYAGLRGDNWNKHAVDVTIEGPSAKIELLKAHKKVIQEAVGKALKPSETGLLLREVIFLSSIENCVFPASNAERLDADIKTANMVLSDIIEACEKLCTRRMYAEASEDDINDFFRDALSFMGYSEVRDQTRHGISSSGNGAGEVDILLSRDNSEVALLEGLKLSSVNISYIDTHISKAIINYNALGTATFILAYISTSDFESFWTRYLEHLKGRPFKLEQKQALFEKASPSAAVRVASTILSRDGFDFPVYFLAIKIGR